MNIYTFKNAKILIISLIITVLSLAACSPESGTHNKPDLRAIVSTDLHYLSPELTDNGEYFTRMVENSDAKAMHYSEEIIEALANRVIEEKPDFLIIPGDITFNGEKKSHEDMASKLRRIEEAGISVVLIPGNHDLYSETAASFSGDSYSFVDNITAEAFSEIYADFGYNEALARDENSLSYVYELTPKLRVLMLDVNTKDYPGTITQKTFDWAKEQLENAKTSGIKVIGVSHQNLLTHNPLFSFGYVMGAHDAVQELYEEYGIPLNLSGHMHIQHIQKSEKGLVDIAGSALPVSPCQYGVLDVYDDELVYSTEELDFPHRKEAQALMIDKSLSSIKRRMPDITDEQADFYAAINEAYFAGRTDLVDWREDLYEALLEVTSFSSIYLETIYEEKDKNHTEIRIPF